GGRRPAPTIPVGPQNPIGRLHPPLTRPIEQRAARQRTVLPIVRLPDDPLVERKLRLVLDRFGARPRLTGGRARRQDLPTGRRQPFPSAPRTPSVGSTRPSRVQSSSVRRDNGPYSRSSDFRTIHWSSANSGSSWTGSANDHV